ncbi:pentapeptide repeat-containing protein [Blastomonas aquatica]|uniref:Lysozyme inhibitor LprI N-terminal domain-containing protein n=1 Tax=Blastomonas aquatica TaxID=1510276 RepID=A0ABQ1JGT9_9SPHN|nr:pentapeptide repeat-containing protein [Blastomonas aquatica]GGB68599.1 hypothetical protein GCM10010833_24780 [Blastomonas aquatica]
MVGDFWGENPAPPGVKTVDGESIKTPEALARAVGDGAVIQGGSFSEWHFRGITLENACFVEADLKGSVWTGARARGVGFIKSDLTEASLAGIQAPGVLFRDAVLTNVKASGADFTGGLFEGGWFDGSVDGWVLDGANLTDFVFSCGITLADGCPVYTGGKAISARGANLTRAKLSRFRSYGFMDVGLDSAILDQAEISPEQLRTLSGLAMTHPVVLVGGDAKVELTARDATSLIADSTAHSARTHGPSFDCAKASSRVETLLCAKTAGDLARSDRLLGALYAQARIGRPATLREQRQWIIQRDACMRSQFPTDCLRTVYHDRIGALLGQLGERDWLEKGQAALFIEDSLPLSDAVRASALFTRIAPMLASGSMARIVVSREADGSYSVGGDVVGANAHTCSLSAKGLRLDPQTGWYSVPILQQRRNARVFRVIGNEIEVFENGRPSSDLPEAEMDHMSCGMRAAFGALRRIDLPEALLKRYADQDTFEP